MKNQAFQKRLRSLRIDKNLSMSALARELGIKTSRVSMWENSGIVPRHEMLTALSKYFGVAVDYLLGNDHMEGQRPDRSKLYMLQRNLEKLDGRRLQQAETVLKAMFEGVF